MTTTALLLPTPTPHQRLRRVQRSFGTRQAVAYAFPTPAASSSFSRTCCSAVTGGYFGVSDCDRHFSEGKHSTSVDGCGPLKNTTDSLDSSSAVAELCTFRGAGLGTRCIVAFQRSFVQRASRSPMFTIKQSRGGDTDTHSPSCSWISSPFLSGERERNVNPS